MQQEMAAFGMRGFYRDVVYDGCGTSSFDSQWRKNSIVVDGRRLLGGFMRNEPGTLGIQGVLIGQGDARWDALPDGAPPPVNPNTDTRLVDPNPYLVLVSLLNFSYMSDASGTVSTTPTNRLQIVATLGPGVPNWPEPGGPHADGTLREFALVGQLDATQVLINNVRHVAIPKDPASTLVRTIQLVF